MGIRGLKMNADKSRVRAQGTRYFTVSGFPDAQWKEWETDCKKNFGDCRWLKMWNDHMRADESQFRRYVLNKVKELEDALKGKKVVAEPEQGSQGVKTLRGTIQGGDE